MPASELLIGLTLVTIKITKGCSRSPRKRSQDRWLRAVSGETHDIDQADVALSAFDGTHVGEVHARSLSKLFLA